MKIWTIDDSKIDKVLDDYIDYVTNPYNKWRQTSSWFNQYMGNQDPKPEYRALRYDRTFRSRMNHEEGQTPATVWNLPTPHRLHTRAHFISIIHQIYLRKLDSESGVIVLNAAILQKISRHYNYMLEALCHKMIIYWDSESVGKFARNVYRLNSEISVKYVDCMNKITIDDLNKVSREFLKIHRSNIEKAKKITSNKFIDSYNKSVKQFRIKDVESANKYIEDQKNFEISQLTDNKNDRKIINGYHYYKNIVNKIVNKEFKDIDRADSNGRIYHLVTQLPREIRQFSNINVIVDTKNSHPLLFNYFILEYYLDKGKININNKNYCHDNASLYKFLSLFLINNYNSNTYHYFSQELCKALKDKGFGADKIAIVKGIKKDVWNYIYTTSVGKLWDDINDSNPEFSRTEIKVEMFKSLFYSYAKNIKPDKIYAKAFQAQYPTVASIIRHYKITYKNQCKEQDKYVYKHGIKKDGVQLAHKLMQIESAIFQRILSNLFKMEGFVGVGIHDAIAVFDESSVTADVVKGEMENVYHDFGFYPTFSIEEPGTDCGTIYEEMEC